MFRPAFFAAALPMLSAASLFANDIVPAKPADGPLLLSGGTIHPMSTAAIPDGKLLIRGNVIAGLGPSTQTLEGEEDAEVIDCRGLQLYPGLISANGTLGLVEIAAVRATIDLAEPGLFNPSARAEIAVNPDSELLPVTRANGILNALTVPQTRGGMIGGKSALIQLDGWTWEEMLVKAPVGMHVDWPAMRESPSLSDKALKARRESREKRLTGFRELLDDARAYARSKAAARSDFASDVRLEALLPVLAKELPLFIHADEITQIQSALAFTAHEDLRMVLVTGHDVGMVAPLIKERGIPVIFESVQALPKRRWQPYETPLAVPGKLHRAGIAFCIANGEGRSGSASARNLPYAAAAAVPFGLPAEEALKAITLYPARILGVDDRLGSLDVGKEATLIVTTGNPLEITSNVRHAFIRGRALELDSRHTRLYQKYQEKYRREEN